MPPEPTKIDLGQLRLPAESRPVSSSGGGRGFGWLLLGVLLAGGGWQAHVNGLIPWTRLKVDVTAAHTQPRAKGERRERGPRALLTADGYVVARRKANVGPPRSGKIVSIEVEEGDA